MWRALGALGAEVGAWGGAGAPRMEQKDHGRSPPRGWWGKWPSKPGENRRQWAEESVAGGVGLGDRTPRRAPPARLRREACLATTGEPGWTGASLLGVSWHLPPGAPRCSQRKGLWGGHRAVTLARLL